MNRRIFLVLLGLTFLAGCGFQLRGTDASVGTLPKVLRIETGDSDSPIFQKITRKLKNQGVKIVSTASTPVLKLKPPKESKRILGPVSDGDQTELAFEISYSLIDPNMDRGIPENEVRVTLIYIDSGAKTSAKDQSVAQLKNSLENDLVNQIVTSIRLRYEQAKKQNKRSHNN